MGVLKVRSGGVWVPVAQGVGISSPGFVAESLLASDVAIPTGFVLTDILSVTFNAIAGHRYKITAKCQITKLGSGGDVFLQLTNSVNGVFTEGGSQLVVNAADLYSMHMTRATFSGSTTIKLRASVGGGTAKATSTQDGSQLLVEDI